MTTILSTDKLNRQFGGVRAVDNANINVEEKKIKAIIGPNGAGKTTLFNVITGRLPATSGKVLYLGHDITNKPPYELVKMGICRTFQINSLFLGVTVFENVRIAKQARSGGSYKIFSARETLMEINEGTWSILEQVGLKDQKKALASELSYGDQRSLELGIALAGDPKLLLLDEPTAGMSQGETGRITQLIKELAKDITVVLVEHDVEMVMAISDSISVMNQGRIIAEGSPEEIRQNSSVREAYLGEEE